MRLFEWAPDGARDADLWGFYVCEFKSLFSIVILKFPICLPEAYHTHAFGCLTIWLKGHVREHHLDGVIKEFKGGDIKITRRSTFHRVEGVAPTWAICFRGPWASTWKESRGGQQRTLTHGRKVVDGRR